MATRSNKQTKKNKRKQDTDEVGQQERQNGQDALQLIYR